MNNHKVSVIVPLFNEEKTILQVLNKLSEVKRNYNELQIIIINDGSTDSSKKILEENKNL